VPHPPQKIAVAFNGEPQLPQNLAISELLASRRRSIVSFRSERAYSIEPNPSIQHTQKTSSRYPRHIQLLTPEVNHGSLQG
jgi:hypothetical protein